jgi:hypothetical protein
MAAPTRHERRLNEMVAIHKQMTNQWKASPHYRIFVDFLENQILPLKRLKLDTAIVMGLGELSNRKEYEPGKFDNRIGKPPKRKVKNPDSGTMQERWQFNNDYEQNCLARLTQLVAFESWIEILRMFGSLLTTPHKHSFTHNIFSIPSCSSLFLRPN